jgi:CBS domain-containing membrane protein
MSRDVIKLHEDDDIHQALDKFKAVNLMSLPVVNSDIIWWDTCFV